MSYVETIVHNELQRAIAAIETEVEAQAYIRHDYSDRETRDAEVIEAIREYVFRMPDA